MSAVINDGRTKRKRVDDRAKNERRPAGCAQIGQLVAATETEYMTS